MQSIDYNNFNNNNDKDNIYKLYKKIFGNFTISKLIFKFITSLNKEYANCNLLNNSFTQRFKYKEASYYWILSNSKFELLKDKIKMGEKWNQHELTNQLHFNSFIVYCGTQINNHELLKKFYFTNREKIFEIYFNQNSGKEEASKVSQYIYSKTTTISNLILFSIYTQNAYFVRLLLSDLKEVFGIEKFNLLIKESTIITSSKSSISKSVVLSSGNNETLLEVALRLGNLEIIKYLNQNVEYLEYNFKSFYNSLFSNNRNEIVLYLIDELNLDCSTVFKQEFNKQTNELVPTSFDGYFTNLMKLDFQLVKRLIKDYEIPIQFYTKKIQNKIIYNNFNKLILSFDESDDEIYKNLLNFIQSSIYINQKSISNSKQILKKINHLIEFNFKNGDCLKLFEQLDINSNSSSNHNGLVSNIKSIFTSSSSNSMKPINYSDFNFNREIKRIYIFENLKFYQDDRCSECSIDDKLEWCKLVVQFSIQYKEYYLIEKELMNNKSLVNQVTLDKLASCIYEISIKNADLTILEITQQSFNKKHLVPTAIINQQFNYKVIPISSQIKLLDASSVNYFYLGYGFEQLLKYIFMCLISSTSSSNGSISKNELFNYLNSIGQIIIKYYNYKMESVYNPGYTKFSVSLFLESDVIFKFYYYSPLYKDLWNDWNNNFEIGHSIISLENFNNIQDHLNYITFIHNENLGCITTFNSSIIYSKNKQVAKHMLKLGYQFNEVSLDKFSKFDEIKSNYLIYYAFKKLVKISKLKFEETGQPFKINLPTFNKDNYKFFKFLESKIKAIESESSESTYIFLPAYGLTLTDTFKPIYDINTLISLGNLDYLETFILDYQKTGTITNNTKPLFNCTYNLKLSVSSVYNFQSVIKNYTLNEIIPTQVSFIFDFFRKNDLIKFE